MALLPPYSNYEHEIYVAGMLGGRKPARPVDWRELERDAYAMLSRGPRGYIQGGAGRGHTIRANREAFDEWRIVPRMLKDVSERSLERTVLGAKLPAPVLLAPIGVQTVAHPEGELASARAAAHVGLPLIASTAASHTIEQIADAGRVATDTPQADTEGKREHGFWYQLYWPRDRELARSFIDRAESAGYEAVVVTLDTWLLGWRPADLTDGFLPFLRGEGNINYLQDPVFRAALPKPPEEDMPSAVAYWAWQFSNPAVTWADLEFLRECTKLPIVLKGIQSAEDARLAVEHGIEGIIVSNHGGRQVDGAIGSLQALPGVVEAVGERCEVLFDSGIRSGADALKALALGARAVCLGRPYTWGLALGGEQGVIDVLRAFLADLDLNMALSGHASVDELGMHSLVAHPAAGSC
ncbi:MAG TPA: lactate 2-monooxygenase [Solirubrobacteraceae bacterium]|jgi:isopentenyl diphosphate isomerase/L-lactate dehydrogenase-like FMN-dependent dehydrogenase|nr:lactate 2-monooxygenase [Solirubrobacteraceae bacterium]